MFLLFFLHIVVFGFMQELLHALSLRNLIKALFLGNPLKARNRNNPPFSLSPLVIMLLPSARFVLQACVVH